MLLDAEAVKGVTLFTSPILTLSTFARVVGQALRFLFASLLRGWRRVVAALAVPAALALLLRNPPRGSERLCAWVLAVSGPASPRPPRPPLTAPPPPPLPRPTPL